MHGMILGVVLSATVSGAALEAPIRGITISTHRGGQDWASDQMPDALADIQEIGANWVAIHPYGRIGADGSVGMRFTGSEAPPYLSRPIREAKAAGLKILIKPHLAYWGSPFEWRGEIGFATEAEWNRFWREYEAFIVQIARWTQDADGFVVGTELRRTEDQEARWRALIHNVRAVSDVPLTYASNWDDFERVSFWDALDTIGIQAYFPLTDGEDSSDATIRAGWGRWMAKLSEFAHARGKPILFTELGYNQAYAAALRPWEYQTDDEGARELQQRCMKIALASIENEPAVIGVFLWKWFVPPRSVGRNFQLATPAMRSVIREGWKP
jgi:hypothetical protein